MAIGELIYTILIGPLELLFEVIFVIADRHVSNPAYAIIALSLAMNFLVLPLYRRADAVQAEERDRENKLAPWIKHIKQTFKGDERFMMLQAYYKENNYKPTDSLKGSISLLLEIPFFIAAYHFLSNLQTLRGITFGPINDLGAPDALLNIGGTTLNLLPILMTLINVISAAIYMKGFPLKSKIQMYGIAAIFLIFLYKSPAGLVFYWTLNNLFSLIKNIFYKLPKPERVLKILCSATGIILFFLVVFVHPMPSRRAQVLVIIALLCLQIPLASSVTKKSMLPNLKISDKDASVIFISAALFLTILTGLLIPSSIIADSTEEFISITKYYSPYWYIVRSLAIAFGTFVIWFGVFFKLTKEEFKPFFATFVVCIAAGAAANYMMFGRNYGNISSTLIYDAVPEIRLKEMLINGLTLIVLVIVTFLLLKKKPKFAEALSIAMCMAVIAMSGVNVAQIMKSIETSKPSIMNATENEPKIEFSLNGKNVVIIMMDRQIGHFIPFIMHEKPNLKKSFSGFTNYANVFSYGTFTNVGSPGLFGGYDYIPSEMNKRTDKKLGDKHNEALKVMPAIFSKEGYDVTVLDPPYAGYTWIPDLSIYDDIPNIHTAITNGRYSLPELSYETEEKSQQEVRLRNFFTYSLFKISPNFLQQTIYSKGTYNSSKKEIDLEQKIKDLYHAKGMRKGFLKSYAVLCNLPNITEISNSSKNTFVMMSNDLTHEPMLLQEPAFEPTPIVNNNPNNGRYTKRVDDEGNVLVTETEIQITHYQINVSAMLKIGEWLDFLKEKGVYDNTRIIIVSDHGRDIADNIAPQIEYKNDEGKDCIMDSCMFDCVLMVKDFNSKGFKISTDLISNADTPAFATNELIKNPLNPYTNKVLDSFSSQKTRPELIYTFDHQTNKNNGIKFHADDWFTVKDNIYDGKNWSYIGKK